MREDALPAAGAGWRIRASRRCDVLTS